MRLVYFIYHFDMFIAILHLPWLKAIVRPGSELQLLHHSFFSKLSVKFCQMSLVATISIILLPRVVKSDILSIKKINK